MTDLLEEAEQDFMYNRRIEIFKKILPYIIILTIIVISFVSVKQWLNQREAKVLSDKSELFLEVIKNLDSNTQLAKEGLLKLSESNENDAISVAAKFSLATQYLKNNNQVEAISLLRKIIDDGKTHEIYRNFAKIQFTGIKLDETEILEQDKKLISKYLNAVNNERQPFYHLANIYYALYNKKIGNDNEAKITLNKILSSNNINESIKSQAEAIMSTIVITEK